jgi:outer membrane biosynthesis protein TonB
MALKKVQRPVLKGEAKVEAVAPVVEEVVETPVVEETVEETPVVAEPAKTTKTTKAKATKAPKVEAKAKTETKAPKAPKKEVKKVEPKKLTDEPKEEVEEGNRATKKKVMKLTQEFLEENDAMTLSLENINKVINAFETVLGQVTNTQSYKFMDGMIQVQERNGQVYKSPKVDYHSYKAPRTVKTFTQDTEQVDKYRGSYDAETKVFKADGKWNYETKEFEAVDIEIVVGQE